MTKRIKYQEGDIISIPLTNGKTAVCKIIFAPTGQLKQVIGCTVIDIQYNLNLEILNLQEYISIDSNPRNTNCFFTGNQFVKNGNWTVLGTSLLSEKEKTMQNFIYACQLYHNEELIRNANEEDYSKFPTLNVMGFALVDQILTRL